eukprot:m.101712 g.101712  ORF g.101712 m.101712 type:complete len:1044 (-) comp13208_c0_seq4:407-3538(-)
MRRVLGSTVRLARVLCRRMSSVPPKADTTVIALAKTTLNDIGAKYNQNVPISMVTAYDYTSARCARAAEVDMVLVGDSLGQVMLGFESTIPVTMDDMLHHCKAVARTMNGTGPFLVGDLPFGSYPDTSTAIRNATRLVQEGGMEAVKLEGCTMPKVLPQIQAVIDAGIPVVGHIGLTPQTAANMGEFRVQGSSADSATRLLEDALALQDAGCVSVVLEMVPKSIAAEITSMLAIPTIGIGAGQKTSGQVLVFHDIVGAFDKFVPRFSKQYANVGQTMTQAITSFRKEVEEGCFPAPEHSFLVKRETLASFREQARYIQDERKKQVCSTVFAQQTRSYSTTSPSHLPCPSFSNTPYTAAIIGGGAMGSLLAAALPASPQNPVILITSWKEQRDAINRHNGIILQAQDGSNTLHEHVVALSPEQALTLTASGDCAFDSVFVMVKANHTRRASELVSKLIAPRSSSTASSLPLPTVISLQNGMGNRAVLTEVLGDQARVARGVIDMGARIVSPGVVHSSLKGATTLVLKPEHGDLAPQLLQSSQLNVSLLHDETLLEPILWGKLLVNCAINPVTCLLDQQNGQVLHQPEMMALVDEIVDEVLTVMKHKDIQPPWQRSPHEQVRSVLRATATNVSSMLADVRRGVLTEINFINNYVCREGNALGVATPANRRMVEAITRMHSMPQEHQQRLPRRTMHTMRTLDDVRAWRHHLNAVPNSPPAVTCASNSSPPATSSDNNNTIIHGQQFKSVGFVPTMGALHEGHLSLVDNAKSLCDVTVASIFVNPLQFAAHEDLDQYPAQLERDLELLCNRGCDAVFLPSTQVMYPQTALDVTLHVSSATNCAEGASRPHFFNGVATVVAKLFNIVQPTHAFFGQKDAQQCATIEAMVRDLNFGVEVVVCETKRDPDGLAMSSRNARLTPSQRSLGLALYHALTAAKAQLLQTNFQLRPCDVSALMHDVATAFVQEQMNSLQSASSSDPMLKAEVLYVDVADALTMSPLSQNYGDNDDGVSIHDICVGQGIRKLCLSAAMRVGSVRLIDNMTIPISQ